VLTDQSCHRGEARCCGLTLYPQHSYRKLQSATEQTELLSASERDTRTGITVSLRQATITAAQMASEDGHSASTLECVCLGTLNCLLSHSPSVHHTPVLCLYNYNKLHRLTIWGLRLLWGYLASSGTKSDVIFLLSDPDFL